ncbi:MAG: YciI family protein [Fulvivirga sp.]
MRGIFTILFLTALSGAYGQEYVYVFLNTNPAKQELPKAKVDSLQKEHLANIQRLASEEKLLVAGPFEGGGGIFIMNTTSTKEAEQWIRTDPAIAANRYRIEILPWTPRVGGACLISTDAEFVTYTFVRYNTHITKFNVQDAPIHFKAHDDYIDEIIDAGNVVSEGVFANSDGGVMILRGDIEKAVIMNDPAVQNGIIQPEVKKIWVGKGSFCEK